MAITTVDQLLNALGNNSSSLQIDKASLSSTSAGQYFSLWTASGLPGTGAAPTAASVPTKLTSGAFDFTNQTPPATSYIGFLDVAFSNTNSTVEIHDRLAHMGGLSGIVTTAQGALSLVTTDPGAERLGVSNYSGLSWWLEVYSPLGSTGVNATVNVTYDDDSTANIVIALGATPRQGRLYPIVPGVASRFIKAVNSVTLSATTGTAGNFGITATRKRAVTSSYVGNMATSSDAQKLGFPEVPNDACLMLIMLCSTTTTGTVKGSGKIVHG